MTFKNLGLKYKYMVEKIIKRAIFGKLKEHLSKKEVSFLVGPRQAGKTTLMLLLQNWLEKGGGKTVFLNLDIETDKRFFESQTKLIQKIQLEIGKQKGFVFIDEIQRKENAGIFLKGIYDMNLPYKFVVSGSGSVELKEKIHESLVGRKRVFALSTLSFEEFVNFKTDYQYENRLLDFFIVEEEKTRGLLEEYLNFGGYPRVVLEETLAEKRRVIDEIYRSYLEKDIWYLLQVRKTEAFSSLVKLLAGQIGSLVNFSELSTTLGVSVPTIKDYLWYLEKTFIVEKVTPYFRNIRKEITKSPVYYFCDLGLRNYTLGSFGNVETPEQRGFLFENFVFKVLKEKTRISPAKVHFWRTKNGAEVDFVVDLGRELLPFEVKYKVLKTPKITRSLRSFLGKYQPERAQVVNLKLEQVVSIGKTKLSFLPFYKIKI